jgi:hypothetical protein
VNDPLDPLLDNLMADGFVAAAFRLQVLITLARRDRNPAHFVREFVKEMHARIDANDDRAQPSEFPQIHEIARTRVDSLGTEALKILSTDRGRR